MEKVIVSEEQVEEDMHYLSSTDQREADLKARAEHLKLYKEVVIDTLKTNNFDNLKSDAEKTSRARSTDEYKKHLRLMRKANAQSRGVFNKRNTADKRISIFQTLHKRGAV